MEILIPLPVNSSANTYKELNSYLKQLELAVHHAQKSVESAEKTGVELTEDAFVSFKHPAFSGDDEVDMYDDLQSIELCINLG